MIKPHSLFKVLFYFIKSYRFLTNHQKSFEKFLHILTKWKHDIIKWHFKKSKCQILFKKEKKNRSMLLQTLKKWILFKNIYFNGLRPRKKKSIQHALKMFLRSILRVLDNNSGIKWNFCWRRLVVKMTAFGGIIEWVDHAWGFKFSFLLLKSSMARNLEAEKKIDFFCFFKTTIFFFVNDWFYFFWPKRNVMNSFNTHTHTHTHTNENM